MAASIPEGPERENYKTTSLALRVGDFDAIKSIMLNTTEDCMRHPSISMLALTTQPERLTAYIEAEIIRASAQLNTAHKMNSPQVIHTAQTIIETFSTETLADITLVLKRGSSGYYGADYHRIDCSTIIEWIKKHLEEKAYLRERDNTMRSKEEANNKVDYKAYIERRKEEERIRVERLQQELERKKKEAASYYEHRAKPKEWVAMRQIISSIARVMHGTTERMPKGMALFNVNDQQIFCSSQEEAQQIYDQALEVYNELMRKQPL